MSEAKDEKSFEAEVEAEKKKISELFRELKNKDSIGQNDEKLNWMYRNPSENVEREEYLLGRTVDKALDSLTGKDLSTTNTELANFPKRSTNKEGNNEQVEIHKKVHEDPLFAMKQREIEARKQLLNNPLKVKELKKMVEMEAKKKEKIEKLQRKEDKRRRKDERVNYLLIKELGKLKDKIDVKSLLHNLSDSDSERNKETSDKKQKNNERHLRKKRKKSSESSASDSDSESESEDTQRHRSKSRKKVIRSKKGKKRSESPSSPSPSADPRRSTKHKPQSSNKKRKVKFDSSSSSDSESSSDTDVKSKKKSSSHSKESKKSKLRKQKSSKSSEESSSDTHRKTSKKKNRVPLGRKKSKARKHKSSESSEESNSETNLTTRKKKKEVSSHSSGIKKSKTRKRKSSESSEESSSDSSQTASPKTKKKVKNDSKSKSKEQSYKKRKNSNSELEDHDNIIHGSTKKPFGLSMLDGSKPDKTAKNVAVYKKEEIQKVSVDQKKPRALTEKEREYELEQMMKNAKWRKTEREADYAKHKIRKQKEDQLDAYDESFIKNQMAILSNVGSMADRVKSKMNSVQKSGTTMDRSFVRK